MLAAILIKDPKNLLITLIPSTKQKIKAAWKKNKQRPLYWYVEVYCTEKDALILSELFFNQYADRNCCFYRNGLLSLFCGIGDTDRCIDLRSSIKNMVQAYFVGKNSVTEIIPTTHK